MLAAVNAMRPLRWRTSLRRGLARPPTRSRYSTARSESRSRSLYFSPDAPWTGPLLSTCLTRCTYADVVTTAGPSRSVNVISFDGVHRTDRAGSRPHAPAPGRSRTLCSPNRDRGAPSREPWAARPLAALLLRRRVPWSAGEPQCLGHERDRPLPPQGIRRAVGDLADADDANPVSRELCHACSLGVSQPRAAAPLGG